MPEPETDCTECGKLDDLSRHAATCQRAMGLGLPRLAEDEEPILDSPVPEAKPEPGPLDAARERRIQVTPPPDVGKLCIACGEYHATEGDRKIGKARVAHECEWLMNYPGMSATDVIAGLETQLDRLGMDGSMETMREEIMETHANVAKRLVGK